MDLTFSMDSWWKGFQTSYLAIPSLDPNRGGASLMDQTVTNLPAKRESPGFVPGLLKSLKKRMAALTSILTRKIPWKEEPGGL